MFHYFEYSIFSGQRFDIKLNNNQNWIVYTSSDVGFAVNGDSLVADAAFTGSLRYMNDIPLGHKFPHYYGPAFCTAKIDQMVVCIKKLVIRS